MVTHVTIPDGSSSATFRYTDTAAGTPTITAADQPTGPDSGLTDATQLETVTPAAATHFSVSAPATAIAGQSFDVTVTALDQFGNTDTNYAGSVAITSTDGTATLPAASTLTNGTGTFPVTLTQAGNHTVTATDDVTSSITGTSGQIAVTHASAASVSLALVPDTVPADGATTSAATVLVTDTFGNPVPGETVTLDTSGDAGIGPVTDQADGSYTATITASTTSGDETITAHDGLLSNPQTLHETALEQTITFDQPADHTYGDAPFASGATSDSGLTVSLSSTTPTVCDVSGLDITVLAAGTCQIHADQAGNAQYAAAPTVSRTFPVARGVDLDRGRVLGQQPVGLR